MTVAGLVLVGIAAAIHVYIFVLESVLWLRPATMRTFGVATETDARTMRPLALNQGFYNLFLAVVSAVGIVLVAVGAGAVGYALIIAGAGSMVAAGLVLVVSNPRLARSAAVQAAPPAVGLICLLVGVLIA